MKKLILTSVIIFSSLFLISNKTIHAHMSSMMGLNNEESEIVTKEDHSDSIEVVLQSILESQNVSTIQGLDLSKVSDDEWEHLGDAVMELQHPGSAHKVMDRMMGGEGSENLRQMHKNMGQTYLGYGNSNYGPGMMVGGGMMNFYNDNTNDYWKGGGDRMMSNFGSSPMSFYGRGFGFIAMLLFWGLIIFGVAGLLKWIISQWKVSTKEKSTLDIIKERYAKGEIDKKKFEEMKKDLK